MSLRLAPTDLAEMADDELAARAQAGDDLAQRTLIERYRRFARAKGRGYFLVGGDSEDVEQEALIGLYKAARDFANVRFFSERSAASGRPAPASCWRQRAAVRRRAVARARGTAMDRMAAVGRRPFGGQGRPEPACGDRLLPSGSLAG